MHLQNPLLAVAAMTAAVGNGEGEIDGVQTSKTPYRNATAACEDGFEPLSKLVTRVMRAMSAQGIPQSVIDDANTYARKIKGQRKTPAKVDDPSTPGVDESRASHSAAQMSRSQRMENFESLRLLLESQALYTPNENDLKIITLATYLADLEAKTAAVGTTFVPYSNAMASRDDVLYINDDSIVKIGKLFKLYVQAAFGRDSTEWNQVKGLEFKDLRRK